jgi:hypothetical protein
MSLQYRSIMAAALAATAALAGSAVAASSNHASSHPRNAAAVPSQKLELTASSAQLAACMPHADVDVTVKLTTDDIGFDSFQVKAEGLPPKRSFTVFLLQQADSPFGAAEYIGDITTDATGTAKNTFKLIVQEAFSSTLVNGSRVRVDLNRVGMWFADPKDDDFCLHDDPQTVTPFDGDNAAGVQAFNSRNAAPLPAP